MSDNPILQLWQELVSAQIWDDTLHLKRHQYLTQVGQRDTNTYFVVSGSLRIFMEEENEEHTIRFGYQNSFVNALDSFFRDTPTAYTIQALKATEVKVIKKDTLFSFLTEDETRMRGWSALQGEVICQQLERERDLLISAPEERYRRVLERSPQLFQEIPLKYIASYLRMTPETLSRIRKS